MTRLDWISLEAAYARRIAAGLHAWADEMSGAHAMSLRAAAYGETRRATALEARRAWRVIDGGRRG